MKNILPALLYMGLIFCGWSKEIAFYIGTNTHGDKGKGIYLGTLDTDSGQLGAIQLASEVEEPTFLALSPDQQFLYAAQSLHPSAVKAFQINEGHALSLLNTQICSGGGACHLTVDATGRNVLVANYETGDILCLARKPDGTLGEQTAFLPFKGSGPYISRQASPHAHSVYLDPSNQFLYACDLGTDHIWTYHFYANTGTLIPVVPAFAKVPSGAGCRHLAQSPDGRFIFVNNEMGMSVSSFSRDVTNGTLNLLQTVSMLPKGIPPEPNTSAEIVCHPNGHYLYVSNRTCDTICCFRIASDGSLDSLKTTPSAAKFPRSFAIDPSGKWLLIAGQKSNTIVLYQIDSATGNLTATQQIREVPSPTCILFVER